MAWTQQQLREARVSPKQIVIQVAEQSAESMFLEARDLQSALHERGSAFAIEHFGVGKASLGLIEQLPMDYLKIDRSLMQGLCTNNTLQQRVGGYVRCPQSRAITTIAERVTDANTMAVLWQLGVEAIQGFYVNGPDNFPGEAA